MEKNLVYGELLDIYKGLLTDKQAEALDYYYYQDYSLAEISELMDVSRQGVRDFIKRGEAIMDEAESKLSLLSKFRKAEDTYDKAQEVKLLNKKFIQSRAIDALLDSIMEDMRFIKNSEVE